jgi:hypothetical protein
VKKIRTKKKMTPRGSFEGSPRGHFRGGKFEIEKNWTKNKMAPRGSFEGSPRGHLKLKKIGPKKKLPLGILGRIP